MKSIIFVMVNALILGACSTGKLSVSNSDMETKMDSISYALGHDLGKNLKSTELDINTEMVYYGYTSGDEGKEAALSEEQAQALIMALQQEIQQKQMAKQMEAMQQQQGMQGQGNGGYGPSKFQVGQSVPEITMPTPAGETMNLSDLRGNIVLVDFWASWCRPCRAENPNVVRIYNKYKEQGFEIFGVSLDRSEDAWKQAIQQDGLTWHHVSDLKFWSSQAAQDYGINAIPYTVLLDQEGKVIAENLRGPTLEGKLQEIFGE